MTRTHGWGLSHQRVEGHVPDGHGTSLSIIGAIALNGFRALSAYQGAMNAQRFAHFAEQALLPSLYPGDLVILDNASIHRARVARDACRKLGIQTLFLPPYHPDLNPIEMAWSKLKSLLRKAAARTLDTLVEQIDLARRRFQYSDFIGWFKKAGYGNQPI